MERRILMIVKNEEEVLENCLKSVGDFPIIICDTGSEDKTVEIAKKYGKVFTDYKWEDSFCKARNHVLSKAPKGWCITIDADEELLTPVDKVKEVIDKADKEGCDAIDVKMTGGNDFVFPRIFKNNGKIKWKGDAHNYLTGVKKKARSDIEIKYGYSPAHKKDPNRTLRILKRAVKKSGSREKFYLAREYSYKKNYEKALKWCDEYLKEPTWAAEWADCLLLKARCLWQLQRGEEARDACLQAIKINTNFKEAIELMAEMSGPINKKRWEEFARGADNSGVLFVRTKEKGKDYYDKLFREQNDFSRYDEIHKEIGKIVGNDSVVDAGCGRGDVAKYIKNYKGFDFSEEAIKVAKKNKLDVWVGSVYDKKNYIEADTYLLLEVLEHVDESVLDNIPKDKRLIFSVPNFDDPSHLRTYTPEIIKQKFNPKQIITFSWKDKWVKGNKPGSQIYLVEL